MKFVVDGEVRRSWKMEYTLEEFGDNAKPAIVEETAQPSER